MAAIPTYLYVGDYQGAGTLTTEMLPRVGATSGLNATVQTLTGGRALNFWTYGLNDPRLLQTVPDSDPSGPLFPYSPWWDGSSSAGAGAWKKYHHLPGNDLGSLPAPVADSLGDNWFDSSLKTTGATARLMWLLGKKHADPTGFRMLKFCVSQAGFGGSPNVAACTTVAGTKTITRATGSWVTDGYRIGDLIETTGATPGGDNTIDLVASLTATTLTISRTPNYTGSAGNVTVKANKWNGGAAYSRLVVEHGKAVAAFGGGDTPDYRAIFLDASASDIWRNNDIVVGGIPTWLLNLQTFVTTLRAYLGVTSSQCPVFLVMHSTRFRETSSTMTYQGIAAPTARIVRTLCTAARGDIANLYLVDMDGAEFAPHDFSSFALEDQDPKQYQPVEHLKLGQKLYDQLLAYETAAPSAEPGSGIATYFLLGDSQGVGTIRTDYALIGDEASILGPEGGTVRQGQYIWDDVNGVPALYNLTTLDNTLGTTASPFFGPSATILKKLGEAHPDGVLLIKIAQAGASVTLESVSEAFTEFGLTINTYDPDASGQLWDDLVAAWNRAKLACIQTLNRVPDVRGAALLLGDNDSYGPVGSAAFASKLSAFVDRIRESFGTRTGNDVLGIAAHLPPDHTGNGGQSVLGVASAKQLVRETLRAKAGTDSRFKVASDADLELLRTDKIHYGGEANYEIGYRLGELLVELAGTSATSSGAGGGDDIEDSVGGGDFEGSEEPVALALVVEDGTGRSDADSYASLEELDVIAAARGSPTEWTGATTAQRQNWARQAAGYGVDLVFGRLWAGYRTHEDQALDWPRTDAGDARTGRRINDNVVPRGVKLMQFEFAYALALGVDPLENLNPADPEERARFATATSDAIPGGFREDRTYDSGVPINAVLVRMHQLAWPFLIDDDARVGLA